MPSPTSPRPSATAPVGRPRSGGRQRPGGTPREEILDAAAELFTSRGYAATSTRMIAHYWTIGTDVYAARTESGRICIVTIVLGTRSASSCTTDAAFRIAGLFIQVDASADPVDDSGRVPTQKIGLLWLKDGTITISV